MEYIKGKEREQITLFPELIEDYISNENPVRFIEAFIDKLDLEALGFKHATIKSTGRPPYNPKDEIKLCIYGYLNKIRSSRGLEKETKRNIELMWLMKRLTPDHKTISNFIKENGKAIRKVFKEFIKICRELELFSAELIAIDSTKFRAINARDKIKDKRQLEKSILHIEASITEYLRKIEENDEKESGKSKPLTKEELQEKISYLEKVKEKLEDSKEEIEQSGNKYVSLTDADCRLVKDKAQIIPGYSIHTAVDSKHCLIVDYEVSQDAADNDHLSKMAIVAKQTLEVEKIEVCADAGYYNSIDIKKCEENNVICYIPVPEQKVSSKTNVPQQGYHHKNFTYDHNTDSYYCPKGNNLQYYHTTQKHARVFRVYRTAACRECFVKKICTTSPRGRYIYRWEDEHYIERLKERMQCNPEMYKKRKSIVEHPFGTIKKIWGYSTLLSKGIEKVSVEISLMTLAYNLRRVFKIIGIPELIKAL